MIQATGLQARTDDILVTGTSEAEHLDTLDEVLKRLEQHGIKASLNKCKLLADSVKYLGHSIDAKGKRVISDKIEAVVNAPIPTNVTELRSFLGLLNYYRSFLPIIATNCTH